jgi:hypothetical protein
LDFSGLSLVAGPGFSADADYGPTSYSAFGGLHPSAMVFKNSRPRPVSGSAAGVEFSQLRNGLLNNLARRGGLIGHSTVVQERQPQGGGVAQRLPRDPSSEPSCRRLRSDCTRIN